jgi:hypothetical protein
MGRRDENTATVEYNGVSPGPAPWLPGVWERFPWSALMSLTLVLACAMGCVAVLLVSNNQRVDSWPISPSVYLAILTAIANSLLRYTFSVGVVVAWWKVASTPHTISDLRNRYLAKENVRDALIAIVRGPSLIAMAAVLTTIVVVDGPLVQRATSTLVRSTLPLSSPVNITVATELPFGMTGLDWASDYGSLTSRPVLTSQFSKAILAYNRKDPITANVTGCSGQCNGTIEAAGLWKDCNSTLESVDFNRNWGYNDTVTLFNVTWFFESRVPPMSFQGHGQQWVHNGMSDSLAKDEPYIELNITWADHPTPNGVRTIHHTFCRLFSATSYYDIRVQNQKSLTESSGEANIITINGNVHFKEGSVQNLRRSIVRSGISLQSNRTSRGEEQNGSLAIKYPPTYFPIAPNFDGWKAPMFSTIGGLSSAAQDFLSGNFVIRPYGSASLGGGLGATTGALTSQFMNVSDAEEFKEHYGHLAFSDPTSFIFQSLDEIMFRLAVDSAKSNILEKVSVGYVAGSTATQPSANFFTPSGMKLELYSQSQIIEMVGMESVQFFTSNFYFLLGALLAMMIAAVSIILLFNGFWHFGRDVSMDPIEIAKAFRAPLMSEVESNATVDEIVQRVGHLEVTYGAVIGETYRRLQFDEAGRVQRPIPHEKYD